MILLLVIIVLGGVSALINALMGVKYGMRYADMIIIGILLTPIMPLYICIQAAIMDSRK